MQFILIKKTNILNCSGDMSLALETCYLLWRHVTCSGDVLLALETCYLLWRHVNLLRRRVNLDTIIFQCTKLTCKDPLETCYLLWRRVTYSGDVLLALETC